MDLIQLSQITGLPLRRVRYVLEHRVLPDTAKASRGRRVPRSFSGFEAFGIAIAAVMMVAGLKRSLVAECLETLTTRPLLPKSAEECALLRAYGTSGQTVIDVGDGVNIRVHASGGYRPFDTNWRQATTGAPVDRNYAPLVMIRIDVDRLRQPIRRAANE